MEAVTGPRIEDVTENPGTLADDEDLVVTATVQPLNAPVDTVSLVYRTMYENEVTTLMVDDGTGTDTYTVDIPGQANRTLVRYPEDATIHELEATAPFATPLRSEAAVEAVLIKTMNPCPACHP